MHANERAKESDERIFYRYKLHMHALNRAYNAMHLTEYVSQLSLDDLVLIFKTKLADKLKIASVSSDR